MNEIPTAEFLRDLAKEGLVSYEKDVLSGPLFRKIMTQIEDAALAGYTGHRKPLDSRSDDFRALKVIQKELQAKGFYCEFETEEKIGLIVPYKQQYFHVKWGEIK